MFFSLQHFIAPALDIFSISNNKSYNHVIITVFSLVQTWTLILLNKPLYIDTLLPSSEYIILK